LEGNECRLLALIVLSDQQTPHSLLLNHAHRDGVTVLFGASSGRSQDSYDGASCNMLDIDI